MCRSDALIGLSSTRTSASPGAKGGVGISASCNTLFGSPVSRKINAFIHISWVFRQRPITSGCLNKKHDYRARLDAIDIAGDRLRRLPLNDVVWGIEGCVDPTAPRVCACRVYPRQLEI